jgi:crotonobetainyl-CoA:carnitine CoA-transferase CaiB-like acyl-CoA transferase
MDPLRQLWAESGAMALTGRADGPPLGAPPGLFALMDSAAAVLRDRTGVDIDGLALLGERAALEGLCRRSPESCGGGTRLLRAADGWIAVSMARPDDVASFPAWLERSDDALDTWKDISRVVSALSTAYLDSRAALLGLPIAALGSVPPFAPAAFGLPIGRVVVGRGASASSSPHHLRVVDLSSLWAGPLCGSLLAQAGAEVIKLESSTRPDGARLGNRSFFDLLNGTKKSVVIDVTSPEGVERLRAVIMSADIVIESARPRGLEQLGLVALDFLGEADGPKVWVSITSHGRGDGWRDRVGFGDVAAAAGGLVAMDNGEPCFLADAVTDPMAGLVAAAAAMEAWASDGSSLLNVGMAPMAASVAGPLLDTENLPARPPRARTPIRSVPAMGSDTQAVLSALPRLRSIRKL